MAIPLRFQLLILLLLISLFISGATAAASSTASSTQTYPAAILATILSSFGYQEVSTAAAAISFSTDDIPLTIFAPSDASLLTCPSCSVSLLLQELSLPGIYPIHFLRKLASGTKIESLAPNRCLTITTDSKDKVFVNGVEITRPDLFNDGLFIIHGLQGNVSHLSHLSCNIERMASLSFPRRSLSISSTPPPPTAIMRLMLKDAITRLETTGYMLVSLTLHMKYAELLELESVTIFALDDVSIIAGEEYTYLSNFRYHVVPNRRLTAAEQKTSFPPPPSSRASRSASTTFCMRKDKEPEFIPCVNYPKENTINNHILQSFFREFKVSKEKKTLVAADYLSYCDECLLCKLYVLPKDVLVVMHPHFENPFVHPDFTAEFCNSIFISLLHFPPDPLREFQHFFCFH